MSRAGQEREREAERGRVRCRVEDGKRELTQHGNQLMFYSLSTNDIHKRMNTTDRQGNPKQQLNTQRQTHTHTDTHRERDTYTNVNNETDCDLYLLVWRK